MVWSGDPFEATPTVPHSLDMGPGMTCSMWSDVAHLIKAAIADCLASANLGSHFCELKIDEDKP